MRLTAGKRQAGFSLVEMVVVIALLAVMIGSMATIVYQLVWIPGEKSDTLTVIHDVRQAVRWITTDARQASTFTAGTDPDYGTFEWTDRSSLPVVNYSVRYYYSVADKRLIREETANSSVDTIVVSDNILNYSDISITETDDLVEASITAKIENPRKTIDKTTSLKAQMRTPAATTSPSTPPPYTLAWDDFESGAWTGGTGWTGDWYSEGDSYIVDTNSPYEGLYHMQLRRATGYVDRAVDLSGQSNIRLQFWARASSFEVGEFLECLVSSDGNIWHTVRTWVDGEDDDVYRYEDIDLSSYTMSGTFYIAFDAQMSATNDYFWVDDLKVVRTW